MMKVLTKGSKHFMPSGPGAVGGLILLSDLHTSAFGIISGRGPAPFVPPQSGSCSQTVCNPG